MKTFLFASIAILIGLNLYAQDVKLPIPDRSGGKPLMEALNQRRSTRTFQEKELSLQQLSNLLWAANGFNRDDKRTAPTANNRQELELYITTREALYFYDARNHSLREIKKGDLRGETGAQDFVAKVPLNLIFVVDMQKASGRSTPLPAAASFRRTSTFTVPQRALVLLSGVCSTRKDCIHY